MKSKLISLHPLKFNEAIQDVLKVKPEPKDKPKRKPRKSKAAK